MLGSISSAPGGTSHDPKASGGPAASAQGQAAASFPTLRVGGTATPLNIPSPAPATGQLFTAGAPRPLPPTNTQRRPAEKPRFQGTLAGDPQPSHRAARGSSSLTSVPRGPQARLTTRSAATPRKHRAQVKGRQLPTEVSVPHRDPTCPSSNHSSSLSTKPDVTTPPAAVWEARTPARAPSSSVQLSETSIRVCTFLKEKNK